MTRVIAALDNSLAASPTLATARALARLLGAELDAVHVRVDGQRVARNAADAAGISLQTVAGQVVEQLTELARSPDVAAVVVGARGTPAGRRPLGSTAFAIATSLPKPVVVVPPEAPAVCELRRVLVPVEAGSPAVTPRTIVELARGRTVDVVVLHVHQERSLPAFTDQPQHEQRAWRHEFLRRYCPWGIGSVRLEIRVGRCEELVPRVAEEQQVDLIAIGWAQELAHGRAPIVRATLERSRLPVLLVPVSLAAPTAASPKPGAASG
jgi:nucleotide-binding universal stress UspA family protein